MQLIIGFLLAIIIAYLAYRARSLDRSGAYAAFIVGTVIFGLGGWGWAILLLTFFITSSGLSRAFKERKREANEKYAKGGQRDAGQVFGNGGIAALFAALHVFFPEATWPWLGFAASLAAVNADTWATELGVLNPTSPRLITNLRKVVEKGTSGGVSLVGTLASLAGAGIIGLLAALLSPTGINWHSFYGSLSLVCLARYSTRCWARPCKPFTTARPARKRPSATPRIAAAPRQPKSAAGSGWIMIGSILRAGPLGW